MDTFYRAVIKATGEILESDDFKTVYHRALTCGKDYFHYKFYHCPEDCYSHVIILERVTYSDEEYINGYGYPQRDIVDRDIIAYMAISRTGYTIDNLDSVLDVDRTGWKSVQSGKEV